MKLDTRVGFERNQFASQAVGLPKHIEDWFCQAFTGEETPDFNEGLLAGFSSAYAILEQVPPDNGKQFIGATVALLASRI
jgi:hypothetical protein